MQLERFAVNEEAVEEVVLQVKLAVNNRLFQQGYITEEIYTKAKAVIISGGSSS